MRIVLFTHPAFLNSQSMPRFAAMLVDGLRKKGHRVEVWSPKAKFFALPFPSKLKKWLGYIDQYLLFPALVKKMLRQCPEGTLFVFADQALGPWVPLVEGRPHVIHCHDFLAQQSAKGVFKQNAVGWTGVYYQKYIRRGYLKGKNFISVSEKTKADLHGFYPKGYTYSGVVYNGLSARFLRQDARVSREIFSVRSGRNFLSGYLLHVGGNQWYKNREGLIDIYDAWRNDFDTVLPLIMIGAKPSASLMARYGRSPYKGEIYFLSGLDDEIIEYAYGGASLFLFPSLAEGFGWPIAEAMACGTPVLTTNAAPMTEVAGDAAALIDRKPADPESASEWATHAAVRVQEILSLTSEEREQWVQKGMENVKRFNIDRTLDRIEEIYRNILNGRL